MPTVPPIVLTRQADDNAALKAALAARGFAVVERPCLAIRLRAPEAVELAALSAVGAPQLYVFTSRYGVKGFAAALASGLLAAPAKDAAFVAIGHGTRQALEREGYGVAFCPSRATAESLAAELPARFPAGARVAWLRGELAPFTAIEALRQAGFSIAPLTVYANDEPALEALDGPVALSVFASPSAAKRFFAAFPRLRTCPTLAIGQTTADALAELGVSEVHLSPGTGDDELLSAIETLMNGRSPA